MQEYFSHEILMLTFYMAQFEVKYDFNSVYIITSNFIDTSGAYIQGLGLILYVI